MAMAMTVTAEMHTEVPSVEADAYAFLKSRERLQQPWVLPPGQNANARPKTVEMMFQIAHKLKLGWTTRAASVAYFDRVLSELTSMPINALPLLAMGSLLIAAKMEEEEINVPTVSAVLDAAESNASLQELNVMELLILRIWGWNACVVTPMHFIPFYSRIARVYDDHRPACEYQSSYNLTPENGSVDEVVKDPVAQLACCLAEGTSMDVTMTRFLPSVIAASAVALARMQFGIEPHWPHTLSAVSGHENEEFAPIITECCQRMLSTCKPPNDTRLKRSQHKHQQQHSQKENAAVFSQKQIDPRYPIQNMTNVAPRYQQQHHSHLQQQHQHQHQHQQDYTQKQSLLQQQQQLQQGPQSMLH